MSITDESVYEAYRRVEQEVRTAAQQADRSPDAVRLLLATKTVEPPRIQAAIQAGAYLLAENRIQEAVAKQDELAGSIAAAPQSIEQHFIGHLQSNKIKSMLGFASMLHSLDRPSLARKLNAALESDHAAPVPFPVLVQVNTSEEDSKYGVHPDQAQELVRLVLSLPHLELRGFMTIGLFSDDSSAVRRGFRRLREIREQAQQLHGQAFPELSMGMSGDFPLAIAEGATIVRIGSGVFGARA